MAHVKTELLRQLADKMGISPEQAMAVGDGANDLPMFAIAGLGVAFQSAKPWFAKMPIRRFQALVFRWRLVLIRYA